MPSKIENYIEANDWAGARKLIRAELKTHPKDHWLLTRLALSYYEQRNYRKSLEYSKRALAIAPNCPLALWDQAGTLEMLGHTREAIRIYRKLVRRGVASLSTGPCTEGRGWARGLVADCHYRLSKCYSTVKREKESLREFEKHLDLRGPGCFSIYSLDELDARQRKKTTA